MKSSKLTLVLLLATGFVSPHRILGADRWSDAASWAYKTFDNGLDLRTRYGHYDSMMRRLYRQDSDTRIVYVKPGASGLADGSSWLNAVPTVGRALESLGPEGGWVWVAEGEYLERIRIPSKACLFGGFAGAEEDVRDRDPERHRTVLEGDGLGSVVFMERQTILDGFTVRNGGGEEGGGVITGGWLCVIRNNVFTDNRVGWSGGGLLVKGGLPSDGSLGKDNVLAPVITRNLFVRNTGPCGSGLAIRYARSLFVNNTVANNIGDYRARGIEVAMRTGEEPTLLNSIFWNNQDDIYVLFGSTGKLISSNHCLQTLSDNYEGVTHENPQFVDTLAGDFHLMPGSPCIGMGVRNSFPDPDGGAADLGAFPTFRHDVPGGAPVTLASTPQPGMPVSVDEKNVVTTYTVKWYPGYSHPLSAAQYVPLGEGEAWVFESWNDGRPRNRVIEAPASPVTYTAQYRRSYQLAVSGKPAGLSVAGEGWHAPGASVAVSVDPLVETAPGVRHRFVRWEALSPAGYDGPSPSFSVTMNSLVHERLVTAREYKLTAQVSPAGVEGIRVRQEPEGPWHAAGQTVTLSAGSADPHYQFTGWDPGPGNPDGSLSVTLDGPFTATAVFRRFAHPPVFASLPDTAVDEDGSLVLTTGWLGSHVSDANDPVGSLRFDVSTDGPFTFEFDAAAGTLRISPAADYAGTAAMAIRATDPDGAADADTFRITVRPLPDPPGPFGLLSPADGSAAASATAVRFSWQASADPDAADDVVYRVVLGTDRAHPENGAAIDTLVDGTSALLALPGAGTYYWTVEAHDTQGHSVIADAVYALRATPSGVGSDDGPGLPIPGRFSVGALYPNPFNPGTAFDLFLPADAAVRAAVFDIRGSVVRVLCDGTEKSGVRRVEWDGRDASGRPAPSGVYTVRVEAGGRVFHLKATLAK